MAEHLAARAAHSHLLPLAGRSEDERLAKEQIISRRLDSVRQLCSLYEAQLQASLAELHARQDAFHHTGHFSGTQHSTRVACLLGAWQVVKV